MVVHNPNNWHWVDKNCLPWAKTYFEEQIVNSKVEGDGHSFLLDSLDSLQGDCDVTQRKGKVLCIYDMNLVFAVSIEPKDTEEKHNATITISEFIHDQDDDEYVFQINSDGYASEIRKYLVPELKLRLKKFQPDLLAAHEKDVQHAT